MRGLRAAAWAAAALWGAPAAALTIGFDDAVVEDGSVVFEGGVASAARASGLGGEPFGGGRLSLARGLDGLSPGLAGAALSTRDLSWPYGFAVNLEAAASCASAAWAAGDGDWRVRALDAAGETVADRIIAPDARGFELSLGPDAAGDGFTTLLFESLDGYDWIYLDALQLRPAEASGIRSRTWARVIAAPEAAPDPMDRSAAVVPLPAALALSATVFAGFFGWLGLRRIAERTAPAGR
ncbi:MAG: hypothetical protein AAF763_01710 [Pseudomonadota bacterium]